MLSLKCGGYDLNSLSLMQSALEAALDVVTGKNVHCNAGDCSECKRAIVCADLTRTIQFISAKIDESCE